MDEKIQKVIDICHTITILNEAIEETHKLFSIGLENDQIHDINIAYQRLFFKRSDLIRELRDL